MSNEPQEDSGEKLRNLVQQTMSQTKKAFDCGKQSAEEMTARIKRGMSAISDMAAAVSAHPVTKQSCEMTRTAVSKAASLPVRLAEFSRLSIKTQRGLMSTLSMQAHQAGAIAKDKLQEEYSSRLAVGAPPIPLMIQTITEWTLAGGAVAGCLMTIGCRRLPTCRWGIAATSFGAGVALGASTALTDQRVRRWHSGEEARLPRPIEWFRVRRDVIRAVSSAPSVKPPPSDEGKE